MDSIGIRELRQNASTYVAAASTGQRITVTDRGAPVAMLVPISPMEQHLHRALAAHALIGPVRARRSFRADERLRGPSLADAVEAGRGERDGLTA